MNFFRFTADYNWASLFLNRAGTHRKHSMGSIFLPCNGLPRNLVPFMTPNTHFGQDRLSFGYTALRIQKRWKRFPQKTESQGCFCYRLFEGAKLRFLYLSKRFNFVKKTWQCPRPSSSACGKRVYSFPGFQNWDLLLRFRW